MDHWDNLWRKLKSDAKVYGEKKRMEVVLIRVQNHPT
jgi:hypothetical protein